MVVAVAGDVVVVAAADVVAVAAEAAVAPVAAASISTAAAAMEAAAHRGACAVIAEPLRFLVAHRRKRGGSYWRVRQRIQPVVCVADSSPSRRDTQLRSDKISPTGIPAASALLHPEGPGLTLGGRLRASRSRLDSTSRHQALGTKPPHDLHLR
jgi:hypothetical protein